MIDIIFIVLSFDKLPNIIKNHQGVYNDYGTNAGKRYND